MNRAFALVYEELKRRARSIKHNSSSTTALVHEAYLRIIGATRTTLQDRHHFYNYAAEAVRRILVDEHRARRSIKRGGGLKRLDDFDLNNVPARSMDWNALDALERLRAAHERQYRVVMLRFFSGCEFEEIAQMLQRDTRTIARDWQAARAFLLRQMDEANQAGM